MSKVQPPLPTLVNQIKREKRDDDAEIEQLAKKILEAHKAKAQQQQQQSVLRSSGQQTITSYFADNKSGSAQSSGDQISNVKSDAIDIESIKGRFGWCSINKVDLPYILRGGDRFCAVRTVEMKLLKWYLAQLPSDVCNCTSIKSYFITESEAKLLNEINFKHCDHLFGRDAFTKRDLVVKYADAKQFNEFLDTCHRKLILNKNKPEDRCGFFRINGESVVPYTIQDNFQYVPLFYFEGETDFLKSSAKKLEGWDLAYLKFCCKVQGIRNELFQNDTCLVVSLQDVRRHFPPGTKFEQFWPTSKLAKVSSNATPAGLWGQPAVNTSAPAKTVVVSNAVQSYTQAQAQMMNGWSGLVGGHPAYRGVTQQAAVPRNQSAPSSVITNGNHPSAGVPTHPLSPPAAHTGSNQNLARPPPLVRGGIPISHTSRTTQSVTGSYSTIGSVVSTTSVLQAHAPYLQPYQVATSTTSTVRQAALAPKQPPPDLVPMNNKRPVSSSTDDMHEGLVVIPDEPSSAMVGQPYRVELVPIDGRNVPCINFVPHAFGDVMVTLYDFVNHFFPSLSVKSCKEVLQDVLSVKIYLANRLQTRVMEQSRRTTLDVEKRMLVHVNDIRLFFPQIRYMCSRMEQQHAASKRPKIS